MYVRKFSRFFCNFVVFQYYLTADNVEIRLAAVSSCCEMVVPFVGVYKKVTSDKRNSLLQTIYGVLRAVCSVIVNDQGRYLLETTVTGRNEN